MFREAGEELVRWLKEVLSCPVDLIGAGQKVANPRVSASEEPQKLVLCWLGLSNLVVQPLNHSTRITTRLEYLAYPEGGTALDQHARLEALILAAASSKMQCAPSPTSSEWWQALGMSLRPSVGISTDVATETVRREAQPPAREILARAGMARALTGRVLLASGQPCAGVTVRAVGAPGSAVTGNDGRFQVLAPDTDGALNVKLDHPLATGLKVEWDKNVSSEWAQS